MAWRSAGLRSRDVEGRKIRETCLERRKGGLASVEQRSVETRGAASGGKC